MRTLKAGDRTPLDHLLAVMNDPTADPERRDRCAQAAAPYCHARLKPLAVKEQSEVDTGDDQANPWRDLLPHYRTPN